MIESAEPTRLKAFANFFKSYMSLAAVVTAALPIPVASLKLIPTFAAQTKYLSVYTSLFCFLLLAFIFQCRHALARWMFLKPRRIVTMLPFALILLSLTLVGLYHWQLDASIVESQENRFKRGIAEIATPDILENTDHLEVPHALRLACFYLGFFLAAEAAFILMALREYLQDLLGLEERALIERSVSS